MTTAPPPPQLRPLAVLGVVVLAGVVLIAGRDAMAWGPLTRAVLPLVWLAAWSVACIGVGRPIVSSLLGADDPLCPSILVAIAVGAAVLSATATLLAAADLLRPLILDALLAASLIAGLVALRSDPRLPALMRQAVAPGWLLALPLLCAVVVTLVLTTLPVMYDVANYHLAFPERWLAAGGFVEFPRHAFSYYPAAHGMLWTYALAAVGPWGASALHAWFGVVAASAVGVLTRRIAGRSAAGWSVACFVATPAALQVAAFAAADLVVAAWAVVALVVIIGSDGRPRRAVVAGFLVGSAVAAKYLALATVAIPLAVALLLASARRGPRPAAIAILAFSVGAAAPVLPWFARNVVWTGNPLYPYLRELFGGPPAGLSIAAELRQNGLTGGGPLTFAFNSVFALVRRSVEPLGQGGWIGLHWLIVFPAAALVSRWRQRDLTAIWGATLVGMLAWGAFVQFGRFALPALAFGAPLAGLGAAAITESGRRLQRAAMTILLLILLAANATVLGTPVNLDRLAVTSARMSDEAFLARWLDYAPLLPTIERRVPVDGVILLVAEARSLYIPRRVLVEDPYRPPWLGDLARGGADPAVELRARGVTHVLVNEAEETRFAALRGATSYWDGLSDVERAAVASFLRDGVEVEARVGRVWLGRILPAPRSDRATVGEVTPPAP